MRVMAVSNRYALRELKPEGRKHATRTGTALPEFALNKRIIGNSLKEKRNHVGV